MCLGQLIEVLKEPEFQSLESEYKLMSRLSMVCEVPKIIEYCIFKDPFYCTCKWYLNCQRSLIVVGSLYDFMTTSCPVGSNLGHSDLFDRYGLQLETLHIALNKAQ